MISVNPTPSCRFAQKCGQNVGKALARIRQSLSCGAVCSAAISYELRAGKRCRQLPLHRCNHFASRSHFSTSARRYMTRLPSLNDAGPPAPTDRQYRRVAGFILTNGSDQRRTGRHVGVAEVHRLNGEDGINPVAGGLLRSPPETYRQLNSHTRNSPIRTHWRGPVCDLLRHAQAVVQAMSLAGCTLRCPTD